MPDKNKMKLKTEFLSHHAFRPADLDGHIKQLLSKRTITTQDLDTDCTQSPRTRLTAFDRRLQMLTVCFCGIPYWFRTLCILLVLWPFVLYLLFENWPFDYSHRHVLLYPPYSVVILCLFYSIHYSYLVYKRRALFQAPLPLHSG